ncbi:MOSC domain-containing protein [Vulcaniibacterium tengchongense]|uniref:MOSC domain-containing protein YiiM n=1 Tax=Vulcaniibacterium tengchongense TaxID=1273429 RepID=A0A3N4VJI9_9GAMM|nr:MOSC domain-containing protein [Vulcaniibacterium tengchongense]RPE79889.1 MOSC domain-containing protein YiiM [Vulcaniibacterium tengchongense]
MAERLLDAVLTGRARPYTRPGSASAIDKRPVEGPVRVGALGLAGDEQGDRRVHGGPDKAVHHYPFEHYRAWREELGDLEPLRAPGGFGENLSGRGWTEDAVCLGDRYRIGGVLLEVSQGRQPCWKLNDRFGVADMARRVQASGRTGWYYRVLEPGLLQAGAAIELMERPHPQWPLRRLGALLFERRLDPGELRQALELPLVPSWRRLFEARLQRGEIEDWSRRIDGPR